MKKYSCTVRAIDEAGDEFRRWDTFEVEAETASEARTKAKEEVWDARLTAASCKAYIDVVELP